MNWQILLFILLLPCVYAGNYTIGHQMQPMTGLTVNSNNYSFRFSSGLNEPTYKFNDSYSGSLGILSQEQKFIALVLNQSSIAQPHGLSVRILKQIDNCGLNVYAEEMTILHKKIRYVILDEKNRSVNYTVHGSNLFNYESGTITSKLPLVLSDNIYLRPETCDADIKVPIPKKTIALSWAIIISLCSIIIIYFMRKRK